MVVTLHACDTATDYAIAKAISWNASVILTVPCCQHELNRQIKCDMLSSVLSYGILKDRMAAILTDAVRAQLMECYGAPARREKEGNAKTSFCRKGKGAA